MPNGRQLAAPIPTMRPGGGVPTVDPVRAFLPPEYWNRLKDWFAYNLEWNTIAAAASLDPRSFTVQADSDFLAIAVAAFEADAASGLVEQQPWDLLIRVQDSATGASWMDAGTNLSLFAGRMAGDGMGPRFLEIPRFVQASATVTVELTNLDPANARRIWLSFAGCKLYRPGYVR